MVGFFKQELGSLARRVGKDLNPLIGAALIVYLLLPLGIVLFALPHVSPGNWLATALGWGFIYGVTVYGIYDMTNLSLLAGWSVKLSVVDIGWGGVLFAITTSWAAFLNRWLS